MAVAAAQEVATHPLAPSRASCADGLPLSSLDPQRSHKPYGCPTPKVVFGVAYRCRSRSCPSCGYYRARVLGRVLLLDSKLGRTPTVCMTLTTVDPDTSSATIRDGMRNVRTRLRRHGYPVDDFTKIEFTSGRGTRSGGRRRIHGHNLTKGLDGADLVHVGSLVQDAWHSTTGASVVEVAELRTLVGQLHYLSLHHGKRVQLPPRGWRGMAERSTRGFWNAPIGDLRERARRDLAAESLVWSTGGALSLDDALWWVDHERDGKALAALERAEMARELHAWRYEGSGPSDSEIAADEQQALFEAALFEGACLEMPDAA